MFAKFNIKLMSIISLLILLAGIGVTYYYRNYRENNRIIEQAKYNIDVNAPPYTGYDYRSDPLHIWEKYQQEHVFPFDSRVRTAYEYTLEFGAKLFLKTEKPEVDANVTWQNDGWQVKLECQPQLMPLEDHLPSKLPDLALVSLSQRKLLGTFLKQNRPPAIAPNPFNEADPLIKEFNTLSMVEALRKLDNALATDKYNPEIFFKASRCYSWLAMFEMFGDMDVNRELCAKALAYYNMGCFLGGKGQTEWLLILMSMDYRGEADCFINSTQPPLGEENLWQVISAYIRYDTAHLQTIIEKYPDLPNIYLLGLALQASKRNQEAAQIMEQAYREHPECIQFLKGINMNADLDIKHSSTQVYPKVVLDRHLNYLNSQGKIDWQQKLKTLWKEFIQNKNKDKGKDKTFQDKLYKFRQAEENIGRFNHNEPSVLIDIDTYKHIAKAEVLDALATRQNFLLHSYNVIEKSDNFLQKLEHVYPDEPIICMLRGDYYWEINNREKVMEYFDKALLNNPPQKVLAFIADFYSRREDSQRLTYPIIKRWREKFYPQNTVVNDLTDCYRELKYYQVANEYCLMSTKLNPFYPTSYIRLTRFNDDPKYIEEGLRFNPDNYNLLLKLGTYYRLKETPQDLEKAIPFLQKAIEISPQTDDAYICLAGTYRLQGDYCKATETLKRYLKYDNDSLTAIKMQDWIGDYCLMQKDFQGAYDVFKETSESYEGGSLLGMAKSLEGLNRLTEAEEYFQRAAERYNSSYSSAPKDLAEFYWRHSRNKDAKKTVLNYIQNGCVDKFLKRLVNVFHEKNQPERILPVYQKTFDSPEYNCNIVTLGRLTMEAGEYKTAIPILKKAMEVDVCNNKWSILADLYNCVKNTDGEEAALKEIKHYITDTKGQKYLAVNLLEKGYNEASMELLLDLLKNPANKFPSDVKSSHYFLLTIAALKCNKAAEIKDFVKNGMAILDQNFGNQFYIKYMYDDLDENSLLSKINSNYLGIAAYCIGLKRLLAGDKIQAETYFLITQETTRRDFGEYLYAEAELKKLEKYGATLGD